jgi:hypothetical protein
VQAARRGANPAMAGLARQIIAMQDQMLPILLAASQVRGEPRVRADYNAVASRGQASLARASDPGAAIQTQMRFLDGCQRDIRRWRGGR